MPIQSGIYRRRRIVGDTADDILEFNVSGDRLRDVITQVTVLDRTI